MRTASYGLADRYAGESALLTASYGLQADRYVGESARSTASYGLADRYVGESARSTASYGLRDPYTRPFEQSDPCLQSAKPSQYS